MKANNSIIIIIKHHMLTSILRGKLQVFGKHYL